VRLEVCHHLLAGMCEEAGLRLQRSAVSPNIRERRDFSVALFDHSGALVAQAAHIPVHLGTAGDAVAAAREVHDLQDGDVCVLNDPYRGGTHLPDVTMIRPVFVASARRPSWFVVARAHHADIGGATPGSMSIASDLHGEGLVIPPVLTRRRGREQEDVIRLLLANVRGSQERRVDFAAQEACLALLAQRIVGLAASWGLAELERYQDFLMSYSEQAALRAIGSLRRGRFAASDAIEDDGRGNGPLRVALSLVAERDRLVFDWQRTTDQAEGGLNANRSIVLAACAYALRCLCPSRLPTNEGLFRRIEVRTRRGSLVDPLPPAPVAGGNVETSQRLVDVALAALAKASPQALPAASAGTMSNLAVGGRLGASGFAFYETIPGGAGAGANGDGQSAVQTHMTNTRNTPVEEFEHRYPIRVEQCTVRRGSGGSGRRRGGDGVLKVLSAKSPATVSFLGERHLQGPAGARGGKPGKPGSLHLVREGRRRKLPSKVVIDLQPGDHIEVRTPGGGGHGRG
jgi:N-methylhydantoinase B